VQDCADFCQLVRFQDFGKFAFVKICPPLVNREDREASEENAKNFIIDVNPLTIDHWPINQNEK
jgi:dihydroorotase-like cyclic amidohydrolase